MEIVKDNAQPELRMFFRIGTMPYEFTRDDAIRLVIDLIDNGASEIQITRNIIDANATPPPPEPVVAPLYASALADIQSKYGPDSEVVKDFKTVLDGQA
jgi:hypothetical protein